MGESITRFMKSSDFSKGLVLALAILMVLVLSYRLGHLEAGISLTMGMFIGAPANVPGSPRHRIIGILSATFLGMMVTLIINLADSHLWLLVPVMGSLVFLIAFISVYGFRASLVSFSGLLAIVLSFAHPNSGPDLFIHAGLIGLGGAWYALVSHLFHLFTNKSQTLILMSECMDLTSQYLDTLARFTLERERKDELQNKLLELQSEINDRHELLREILLSARTTSGISNFSRRQVLIFIELIDILELSIGNLTPMQKMQEAFEKDPDIMKTFTDLILELAKKLRFLSQVIGVEKPSQAKPEISELLLLIQKNIHKYKEELRYPEAQEGVLLFQSIYDYLEKQAQKIELIQKVMTNLFDKDQEGLDAKEAQKFITQQDYDWKTFTENLNFDSSLFKHSLRLTLTVLVGFWIGTIFPVQNAYWILLTIIVIMRPGYALTQQRSKNRLYGTLIGAAIATAIVYITQNPYVYGVLAVITFILAFGLVQKNYKSSAIFITLNIVFVYALLKSDASGAIQYRVLDTLTGAGLASLANFFFWPSWQFLHMNEFILKTIHANQQYLKEIGNYYHHKNLGDPAYKLSRKNAFLAIGNLNAAFQRMTQEPKSRQKDLAKIYEVVVLNHTFLSLAASLGTYIRHHTTTEASSHFDIYIKSIGENLEAAYKSLRLGEVSVSLVQEGVSKAQKYLEDKYLQLAEQPISALGATGKPIQGINSQLQEVKMIADQLKWMLGISENLIKAVLGLK